MILAMVWDVVDIMDVGNAISFTLFLVMALLWMASDSLALRR